MLFRSDRDYTGKSLRKQFQAADKLGARYAAVIGDNELEKQVIVLKDLKQGTQQEVPWKDGLVELKTLLRIRN